MATAQRYADAYRGIDFRTHPERYQVGRGEQGVLIAEPYKSELLPLWRFRTKAVARKSAAALLEAFREYKACSDYVGMDMARKYLQMGFTRARRYANRRSGRKYDANGSETPLAPDREKADAAAVFLRAYRRVDRDPDYRAWRERKRAEERARRTKSY